MLFTARRSIFFLSHAGKKFGREITSSSPPEISGAITTAFSHLGGSRSWRAQVAGKLKDWVYGSIGHAEASLFITALASQGPKFADQCFAASRVIGALGFFEASLAYETRGIVFLQRGNLWTRDPSHALRKAQIAIHLGNRDAAVEAVRQFRAHKRSPKNQPFSVVDLLNYVDVWTTSANGGMQRHVPMANPSWSDYIRGKKIVLYGPGNVDPASSVISSSELVARIAGPGSYSWDRGRDLAQGRADIVYLIPDTLQAIGSSPGELVEKLGHFDFVCIKRGEAPYLKNSRKVEAGSRLFLRGHPNMVPLAVIDLLRVPETKVRVIGSDFFASGSSYRPDSIRTTADGRQQTPQGSTGNFYDRSTLMASHNAFQNRRLVKNLLDSGRVTGDDAFLEACSLSDLDYARRLDLHYGQHKL